MSTLQLIGTATGLGFLAGLRLYATVLALGLAIRFNLISLRPEFEQLRVLADWWIVALAGSAFVVEFAADKIPWVDSVWDSVHTVIRPLGAVLIAMAALGEFNPLAQVAVALLTGGVAFTSHSMKAAARLTVNQSPEPFSNSLLSLAGDVAVPVGVWVAMEHPLVIGGIAAASVTVFLLIGPRIFRLSRLQVAAVWGLLSRAHGKPAGPIPRAYVERLRRELGLQTLPPSARAAAGQGSGGLRNSIGYLTLLEDEAVFATRRWFRYRIHRIPLSAETVLESEKGLLLDRLTIRNGERTWRFNLLKNSELASPVFARGPTVKSRYTGPGEPDNRRRYRS